MTTKRLCLTVGLAGLALVSSGEAATQIVIGPSGTTDATLSAWNSNTNYGASPSYELRNDATNAASWAAVRFDLPTLAPGEFITDAAMTFDYFENFNTTPGSMTVHLNRLLHSWSESSVTWNHRSTGVRWETGVNGNVGYADGSNPPTNYDTQSLGSIGLTYNQFGLKTFQSPGLTSVLNQMARGGIANNGFLLNPGRTGGPANRFYLASSERTNQTLPSLTLTVAEQKQYPIGWYDSTADLSAPARIAGEGGNVVIAYNSGTWQQIEDYLDASAAAGVGVILQMNAYQIQNKNTTAIRNFINEFDDHAALRGWYLADEPTLGANIDVDMAETAYDAVKLESSKPVYIAFARAEFENGAATSYANSYDTFLFDDYPFLAQSPQYYDLDDWRGLVESANTQAAQLGKSWWSIPQGFGKQTNGQFDKRLPTANEARYMAYLSVLNGAEGLTYWAHYRAEDSVALPSAPYPNDGEAWLGDVWRSLASEFAEHGDALAAGPIAGLVSDNRSDILAEVFQDPNTLEYYLVGINITSGGEYPTFTFNIPGHNVIKAIYLGEVGMDITVTSNQFADTYLGYAPHVYRLVLAPEPGTCVAMLVLLGLGRPKKNRLA